jgi:hypothetical protein
MFNGHLMIQVAISYLMMTPFSSNINFLFPMVSGSVMPSEYFMDVVKYDKRDGDKQCMTATLLSCVLYKGFCEGGLPDFVLPPLIIFFFFILHIIAFYNRRQR